jgi:hypothetical protein
VVFERYRLVCDVHFLDAAENASDVVIEELIVSRRDMPRFNFPAQVLVKHGREEEMIDLVDERHVSRARHFESSENPTEAPAENYDVCRHWRR